MPNRKTKIVATIGPASLETKTLKELIKAGLNVARINASHGDKAQHEQIIQNIRSSAQSLDANIGIIYDLQGPKIRIGSIGTEPINVVKQETIILHNGDAYFEHKGIKHFPVQYKELAQDVKPQEILLINDGLIELKIDTISADKKYINCTVQNSGQIKQHNSLNAPETELSLPCLTEVDLANLKVAADQKVTYLGLSFVRTAHDIETLRKACHKLKYNPQIIAKIERPEAVKNIAEIAQAADALMVARGDLGIEIPAAKVPIAQRKILEIGRKYGKPVIVATQVLSSMVTQPRPTRAEVSDAANAVFAQADAIMLSNETAIGQFPVSTIETLAEIIKTIEQNLNEQTASSRYKESENLIDAIAHSAINLAEYSEAKTLVIITRSGFTAAQITKYRPKTDLVTITASEQTKEILSLYWGINTVIINEEVISNHQASKIKELLKKHRAVKNQPVVVCNAGLKTGEHLISVF